MQSLRFYSLDLLKFLCAFLVVCFHVSTPYHDWTDPITTSAVPCFFMISGFLIYSSDIEQRCKRGCVIIAKLILWGTLLYFPVKMYEVYITNDYYPFTLRAFFNFILLNENPIAAHLWYLTAYLYVLIIIAYISRVNRLKYLFYIIPILWCYYVIGGVSGVDYLYLRNFLFTGIPCFSLGMLINKYSIFYNMPHKLYYLIGFTVLIICFVEKIFLPDSRQYATNTILAVSLLLIVLSDSRINRASLLSKIGQKDSLYIYVSSITDGFLEYNKQEASYFMA